MTGSESVVGLAAVAAAEQVLAARSQVGTLVDEVATLSVRLRAVSDIPWSGAAARAWRVRVEETHQGVTHGESELSELYDLLSALLERLR